MDFTDCLTITYDLRNSNRLIITLKRKGFVVICDCETILKFKWYSAENNANLKQIVL